jgi:hypothetical protein
MWCSAPLPEGEIHQRKLRSDKYKPPSGRLLENYESDSSVDADEETDAEAGADPAAGVAKSDAGPGRQWLRSLLRPLPLQSLQ